MSFTIYGLTCSCSDACAVLGVRYVGQTNSVEKRFKEHLYRASSGNSLPVYNWIRKHGHSSIGYQILEETSDRDSANELEIGYIASFRSSGTRLLNVMPGGLYSSIPEDVKTALRNNHESRKDTCPKGHPYDEENTKISFRGDGRSFRVCRTCRSEYDLKRKQKAQEKKPVCRNGHPYSVENTALWFSAEHGKTYRRCRTCANARARKQRKKIKDVGGSK